MGRARDAITRVQNAPGNNGELVEALRRLDDDNAGGGHGIVQLQSARLLADATPVVGAAFVTLLTVPITTSQPTSRLLISATASADLATVPNPPPGSGPAYGTLYSSVGAFAPVAIGAPFLFTSDGPTAGGVARDGADPSSLVLSAVGDYLIEVEMSCDEPGQIAIWIDTGSGFGAITSTRVGRATGTSQLIISTIIHNSTPGAKIRVYNDASPAALTLTPIAGGTGVVTATFSAELLSSSSGTPAGGFSGLFKVSINGVDQEGAGISPANLGVPAVAAINFATGALPPGLYTVRLLWAGSAAGVTMRDQVGSFPDRYHASVTVEEFIP